MRQGPQDVLGNHGTNTIFTVWNFKEGAPIKEAFQRICALVINLNHSAYVRFPDDNASCIMGIGYSEQINTVVSAAIETKALMETQGTQAVVSYVAQSTLAENAKQQIATAIVPTSAALVTGSAISGGTVALASGLSIASVTPLAVPIAAGAIVGYGVKKLIDWVW